MTPMTNDHAALAALVLTLGTLCGAPQTHPTPTGHRITFADGTEFTGPAEDPGPVRDAVRYAQATAYGYTHLDPADPTALLLAHLTHPDQASVLAQARTALTEGRPHLRRFLLAALDEDLTPTGIDWAMVASAVATSHTIILTTERAAPLAQIVDSLVGRLRTAHHARDRAQVDDLAHAATAALDHLRDSINALDDAVHHLSNPR